MFEDETSNPRCWLFGIRTPTGAECLIGPCTPEERDELLDRWVCIPSEGSVAHIEESDR